MENILKELTVLYVEDDKNTRASLEKFLRRRFKTVFTAETGEEAIKIFFASNPDIIIVDILLPGISGLEMIKLIRSKNKDCRFLITSSVDDSATILEAIDLNIENYIVKPIDTYALEDKLKNIGESIMRDRQERRNEVSSEFNFINTHRLEENLRTQFIKLLKEKSGKGPRDAVISITGNSVEIVAYGIFNTLDKTLLSKPKNIGHVEETRRLFYHSIEDELINIICRILETNGELSNIKVEASKDKETLKIFII